MKIIVLSNPTSLSHEIELINELFVSGLQHFHLRKPHMEENEMSAFIEKIDQVHHHKIMVHTNHELVERYGLAGRHFPSRERKKITSRGGNEELFAKKNCVFSTSFHGIAEIQTSAFIYDYAFLSLVFDSISKGGTKSTFRDLTFEKHSELYQTNKIIALGGVSEERIELVKKYGFAGAALLGAIWGEKNPVQSFERIIKLCPEIDSVH